MADDAERMRAALESVAWQFANHGVRDGRLVLWTMGLSALEHAFAALGWSDPHFVSDESACEVEGCNRWRALGQLWGALYLGLCPVHGLAADRGAERPAIRQSALSREARRGRDGKLSVASEGE